MKKGLTYSSMAVARLRVNKRQYLGLVLGIFLSIFLVCSLVLGIYGIYRAFLEDRYDKVGSVDVVALDDPFLSREALEKMGLFDRIGRVYISGAVTGTSIYTGWYDEIAQSLVELKTLEGRLPEAPGEIALEKSAMDVLDVRWALGDTVQLDILPVDGTRETRSFTVVGFLREQTQYFAYADGGELNQFPAIVTGSQEPSFAAGRLGAHHVMKLKEGMRLTAALKAIHRHENFYDFYHSLYGISITGQQRQASDIGDGAAFSDKKYELIVITAILALALILSCGVGISGAMEGILCKRQEEIGVLRALGATRRQIRQIFGRENLLIALVVSPASIAISCLAVWVLSRLLPERLVFRFHPGLLLPIGVFSVAVILLSGYLPLARASKRMPMSVIRDTAMLRRSKGLRYKKHFSPARLICARQLRFNPTRQLGAATLVGLMLLCAGLFVAMVGSYSAMALEEYPGFEIISNGGQYYHDYVNLYASESVSDRSISQLAGLAHVKDIEISRPMYLSAILDNVPSYAILDTKKIEGAGMLDDAMYQKAQEILGGENGYIDSMRQTRRQEYLQFLETYQIPGEAYRMSLLTTALDRQTLEELNRHLESGGIHADAIQEGREVIVVAPQVWYAADPVTGGYHVWNSEEAARRDPYGQNARLVAYNDSFFPGQTLSLLHLYQTEPEGEITREDASVTIGAVISETPFFARSTPYILTTEQGLAKLGIRAGGIHSVGIYLDGTLSAEEEQILERQITAISRRSEGYQVLNNMKSYREDEQSNRQVLLLIATVTLLFFTVCVSMIVSTVTRQLNSEGRTIGMFRAVGADEKTVLACYSGQLAASVAGGLGISLVGLGLVAAVLFSNRNQTVTDGDVRILAGMGLTACAMAAVCWLVCRLLLRLRIREVISKSIIENIREL